MNPDLYLYTDLGFDVCLSPHEPEEWEGTLVVLPWWKAARHLKTYPTQIHRFTRRDVSFATLVAILEKADRE
jgi:hypothetical protein